MSFNDNIVIMNKLLNKHALDILGELFSRLVGSRKLGRVDKEGSKYDNCTQTMMTEYIFVAFNLVLQVVLLKHHHA